MPARTRSGSQRSRRTSPLAASTTALLFFATSCGYPGFSFDPAALADATIDTQAAETAFGDDGSPDADVDVPQSQDAIDAPDAPAVADAADAPDAAALPEPSCPGGPEGLDLCTSIPKFPVGVTPVIDGSGEELCGLRAAVLDYGVAQWSDPDPPPAYAAKYKLRLRVAWFAGASPADSGLHLHAFIDDPQATPAPVGRELTHGAALQLYAAGFFQLSGAYNAADDQGAISVVFPGPNAPASVPVWMVAGKQTGAAPPTISFATRAVVGGYEIEARVPWSLLYAPSKSYNVPVENAQIGLDFGFFARDAAAVRAQFIEHVGAATPAILCGAGAPPDCDDRTWCIPRLTGS